MDVNAKLPAVRPTHDTILTHRLARQKTCERVYAFWSSALVNDEARKKALQLLSKMSCTLMLIRQVAWRGFSTSLVPRLGPD
jgi:hypothetical protein